MLWKKIGRMCSYKEAFINGCKIQTPAGTIEITNDVIATVVGGARQIFTELSEWQAKSN